MEGSLVFLGFDRPRPGLEAGKGPLLLRERLSRASVLVTVHLSSHGQSSCPSIYIRENQKFRRVVRCGADSPMAPPCIPSTHGYQPRRELCGDNGIRKWKLTIVYGNSDLRSYHRIPAFPGNPGSNRERAFSTIAASLSKQMNFLPCLTAARAVGPEPQNGSRIKSPGSVNVRTRYSSRATGFWVGCILDSPLPSLRTTANRTTDRG